MQRIFFLFASILWFGTFSVKAQDSTSVKTIAGIPFHQPIPNAGTKKAERFANVLESYVLSIENDDYEAWYALLSDSTKSRVAPHKFKNKFRRLGEYEFSSEGMEVISIETLKEPFANERGTEYLVTIQFKDSLNVSNRVSFDQIKVGESNEDPQLFALNVITTEKSYLICIHKYVTNNDGTKPNENEE